MSLTQIACFADLTEAQIAASCLRSEGFTVLVQNEHWGSANVMMSTAMGGFPLWVPASEAEAARGVVADLRDGEPLPLDADEQIERDPAPAAVGLARTGLALFLALTFGSAAGWLVARGTGRRSALLAVGGWTAAVLCGVWGLLVLLAGLGF